MRCITAVEERRAEVDSRSAELRKQLQDEVCEKECLMTSCDELRDAVKRTETEKTELNRFLCETRAKVAGEPSSHFPSLMGLPVN